jgi:hypothetical protein
LSPNVVCFEAVNLYRHAYIRSVWLVSSCTDDRKTEMLSTGTRARRLPGEPNNDAV